MKTQELLRCLDHTLLRAEKGEAAVREWVRQTMECCEQAAARTSLPATYPAVLCVYPNFVDTVGLELGDSAVRIASVAGGFPAGQTYLEVKMLEAAMAVENGADEVDIVLNLGAFLEGDDAVAAGEIATIRQEIGADVTLKVIIESGALPDLQSVRRATLLAAYAGADFVKTSTGKASVGATPEGVRAICEALNEVERPVGVKVSGGVNTLAQAREYAAIVAEVRGNKWLSPAFFRIGSSSLLSELLK